MATFGLVAYNGRQTVTFQISNHKILEMKDASVQYRECQVVNEAGGGV